MFGSTFGGFAWIQHHLVRLLLYLENNQIPLRLKTFLNYACKLNFLRIVGGGYEFIDQELQFHFEEMEAA